MSVVSSAALALAAELNSTRTELYETSLSYRGISAHVIYMEKNGPHPIYTEACLYTFYEFGLLAERYYDG